MSTGLTGNLDQFFPFRPQTRMAPTKQNAQHLKRRLMGIEPTCPTIDARHNGFEDRTQHQLRSTSNSPRRETRT